MTTPHLNMTHGFVHHIIRNQVDRDNYDKKVKATKTHEKRPLLVSSNKPKKPEQRHYVPPSHRDSSSQPHGEATDSCQQQESAKKQHLFKFVYEDQHGECHHLDVFKDDNARDLASQFGHSLSLSVPMTQALEDFLEMHIRDKQAALKNSGTS